MAKDKKPISTVVKTFNSGKTLCETLEAVKSTEIIIVDSHSVDDTAEIAHEYRAKIIYADKNELSQGLNAALNEASNDWILFLEDDETVPQDLLLKLENYIQNPKKNKNALALKIRTFLFRREIKGAKETGLKFFKKGACVFEDNFFANLKLIEGKNHKIKAKTGILKHLKPDISDKITEIIQKNKILIKNSNTKNASVFFRPAFKFFLWYFLKGTIFCGREGFIFAKIKAFECFIFEVMKIEKTEKNYDI